MSVLQGQTAGGRIIRISWWLHLHQLLQSAQAEHGSRGSDLELAAVCLCDLRTTVHQTGSGEEEPASGLEPGVAPSCPPVAEPAHYRNVPEESLSGRRSPKLNPVKLHFVVKTRHKPNICIQSTTYLLYFILQVRCFIPGLRHWYLSVYLIFSLFNVVFYECHTECDSCSPG